MKYTKIFVILFYILICRNINSQTTNIELNSIISETSLDSLINYVNVLSGEDSIEVNDNTYLLVSRSSENPHNDIAAEFIKQKLSKLELIVHDQKYSDTGRNILGKQTGKEFPDQEYIICAHYDGVNLHSADDNASGVAAILEAARVLSKFNTKYTLIYAFFDEEEIGLKGSDFYSTEALLKHQYILGVINLDMLGWDSNGDDLVEIHTINIGNSVYLADVVKDLNDEYEIGLSPIIINTGALNSDNYSFWFKGYSAVMLSEAYLNGDGNPYKHTSQDKIEKFNYEYFHKMSKLAIASISRLAIITDIKNTVHLNPFEYKLYQNYPNPFNPLTTIQYTISEGNSVNVQLNIYDLRGALIRNLVDDLSFPGVHSVTWNGTDDTGSQVSSGIYFYRIQAGDFIQSNKMLLVK